MAGLLDFLGFGGGQQPMQAQTGQPQQGGMFSGRMAALNDPAIALPLAGALMQPGDIGSNLGQGFALAGQGVATRKKLAREQAVENATAKYLEAQGADTGLVELAKSGAGGEALQLFTQMKKRNDLMTVGKNIYDPNTGQWIQAPAGMNAEENEYYGNPLFADDGRGNIVPYQLGKNGVPKRVELPAGSKIAGGIQAIDTGTGYVLRDRRTGADAGTLNKDVSGEASQKKIGEAQGEATARLPATRQTVNQISKQIDDLKADPYLPAMLGPVQSRLPNTTADSQRVQGKIKQLQGGAFLQAREMLKGGGAITDYEGQKAEEAIARMNTAQNLQDFNQALDDFKIVVQQGAAKLEAAAGQGGVPSPQGGTGTTTTNVPWRIVP